MKLPSLAHLALLGAPLALVACTDPPSSATIRSHLTSDLGHVLTETSSASQTPVPGGDSLAVFRASIPSVPVTTTGAAALARLSALVPARGAAATGATIDADAIVGLLNEQIFIDANHVGDGVYKLPASLGCTRTTVGPTGQTTQTVDATCAKTWDDAQLRIRVEDAGGKLRFSLQVDANHDEPLALTLGHDSLALSISLDDAGRALTALAQLAGVAAPNVKLAGQITGEVAVLGAAHAKVALRVDRDVAIAFADAGKALDGVDAFRLASAKAELFAFELDNTAKTATLALGVGSTQVAIPGTTPVQIDLPGLTGRAVLAAGQPLVVSDVGLGDRTFTVTRGGKRAMAIDLNPDHGRTLIATITPAAGAAGETLAVSPRLDLRATVDHAALGDTKGVYDVTQLLLDGSIRHTATGFAVATGSFRVTTDPASYGVAATAGQCVTQATATDPTSGKSYERWTVGVCN